MTVTGFVDGYYGYNFDHPHTTACPSGTVPSGFATPCSAFRAFDGPSQQLGLNMIELILDKPPDANNSRLGYHLGFGFGNAMNVVNATDPGGQGFAQYLKEAYFSYLAPVGKGLQIDFGKFVTQHGAEVIESKDNWNYSRSLLFTYAIPFYHFGVRAKYAFNDKYQVTAYLVNGWNNIIDNNTGKTLGLQFGWNPNKKVGIVQNYMVGPEETNNNSNVRQLWDTVVTYSPTAKLSLMANYDYGRGDRMAGVVNPVFWSGIAGYVKYAFTDKYALATRYEYYNDHNGFTTGTAQHFNGFTGTFERKVGGALITRLEYRRDMSNRPTFEKGSAPVKEQDTVAAGLVYTFDLKELK
jgi:Putative beta-barrel porin-2, OmpL-like. bbp2